MFAFDTSFAELFSIFEVILRNFINDNRFVINICVGRFIVKLGIGGVESIVGTYYLSEVDFIY